MKEILNFSYFKTNFKEAVAIQNLTKKPSLII